MRTCSKKTKKQKHTKTLIRTPLSISTCSSKNFKNKLYYNIYSEANNFNPINTPEKILSKSVRTHAKPTKKMDMLKKLLCPYPPFYQAHIGELDAMTSLNYDIDPEGNLYVGFEADSTIYKYEKDKYPVKAFGYKGKKHESKNINLSEV